MLTASFLQQQLRDLADQARHLAQLAPDADLPPLTLARLVLAAEDVRAGLDGIEEALHEATGMDAVTG